MPCGASRPHDAHVSFNEQMEMELTYELCPMTAHRARKARFDTGPAGHGAPGVGVAADRSSHTRQHALG